MKPDYELIIIEFAWKFMKFHETVLSLEYIFTFCFKSLKICNSGTLATYHLSFRIFKIFQFHWKLCFVHVWSGTCHIENLLRFSFLVITAVSFWTIKWNLKKIEDFYLTLQINVFIRKIPEKYLDRSD